MAGSHDDIRLTPFFGLGLENIGLSKVYEFSSNRRTIRKVMGGVGHLACMTFFCPSLVQDFFLWLTLCRMFFLPEIVNSKHLFFTLLSARIFLGGSLPHHFSNG